MINLEIFGNFELKSSNEVNKICDNKAAGLIAEGNRYFNLDKCGLGWHGDAERRKVICLSLGADNFPMKWVWFYKNKPISEPFEISLNSGDVYIMSEIAVGTNWKHSSIPTMRHTAGCKKYTNLDKYDEKLQQKKQLEKVINDRKLKS